MRSIMIGDKVYEVLDLPDDFDQLELGKAYIISNEVYIFYGVRKKLDTPGLYFKMSDSKEELRIKKYKKDPVGVEMIVEHPPTDDENIFKQIMEKKDEIINKQEKMSEAIILTDEERRNIFAPDINFEDNILVVIVKTILKERKVNLKELSGKFKSTMELNNYKRSLLIHNKMSIERFAGWMEILDEDWEIVHKKRDTGKKRNRKD